MHSFKSDSCVDHLIVGFNDMLSSKTCEKEPTVASSVGVFHGKTPNWADLTYFGCCIPSILSILEH